MVHRIARCRPLCAQQFVAALPSSGLGRPEATFHLLVEPQSGRRTWWNQTHVRHGGSAFRAGACSRHDETMVARSGTLARRGKAVKANGRHAFLLVAETESCC